MRGRTLTPALQLRRGRRARCGSSTWPAAATAWAARRWRRCTASWARSPPISTSRGRLLQLAAALAELRAAGLLRAYHDRSDGGLFVTLVEMAFAGHCGLDVALPRGARRAARAAVRRGARGGGAGPGRRRARRSPGYWRATGCSARGASGRAAARAARTACAAGELQLDESWADLRRAWSETSWRLRRLRDDPQCADEEFAAQTDERDRGLTVELSFDPARGRRRAVRRPQRAPGGGDPARAGRQQPDGDGGGLRAAPASTAHDVHMTDLLGGRRTLREFTGPGGLRRLLLRRRARGRGGLGEVDPVPRARCASSSQRFFARTDTFALGICNGCQMFAALKSLIPGSEAWPRFVRNRSEQFEARFSLVEVQPLATRCCSRAWPARCCRSRCRTAKGAPSSPRREGQRRVPRQRPGRACAT